MDPSLLFRQLLRVPRGSINIASPPLRPQSRAFALFAPTSFHPSHSQHRYISVPRVITPSFWASMIPKSLRRNPLSSIQQEPRKEWNPATSYIVLGLLVGSQAIQILWLKRDREHFTRRAEAKIDLLREVIEKVQRGEDVDVEKVLGTGDKAMEKEWEEVLKEIGDEEVLFRSKRRRRELRAQAAAQAETEERGDKDVQAEEGEQKVLEDGKIKVETYNGAKFY